MTAVKEGDFYSLNGSKRFVSNAGNPMIIYAIESYSNKPTTFIIDHEYSFSDPWDKMGYRGGRCWMSTLKCKSTDAKHFRQDNTANNLGIDDGAARMRLTYHCIWLGL